MTHRSHSITIRDVAKQAGVSVATVSRYLNHSAPVSEEVAQRIQQVMQQLSYAPHLVARHLATRKTGIIGLLSNTLDFSFLGPLISGLEEVLKQNGYNLLMTTYQAQQNGQGAPLVGPHNTDGVIVFSNTLDDERLAEWYHQKFPVVLVHRSSPPSAPIPYVTIENKIAARKLVDHLIEAHGKRRIAFFHSPEDYEDGRLREMGYRESLEAHSIYHDPRLVIRCSYDRQVARQAIGEFIAKNPPRFDAVFASDDDTAVSVVGALNDHGLEVPDDVAVVGFDDQRFASLFIPPLTTVHAPTREVGAIAAQQMLRLLHNQTAEPVSILPTSLVIRQSCGCPFLEFGKI